MDTSTLTLHIDRTDDYELDTSSISDAFADLQNDILLRVGVELRPQVRLVLEIMKQSATDGSEEYFLGHQFKYHCYLLGLDAEDLLESIVKRGLGKKAIKRKEVVQMVTEFSDEIRECYTKGRHTQKQLATQFDTSQQNISHIVKGLPRRPRTFLSPTFEQDVIAARLEGGTIKRIARAFKVDNAKIVAILRPLGMNKKKPRKNKYYLA